MPTLNCPLSVVLPTFSGGKFLPAAIQSVLAQTYEEYELVVIDDGSTDDTETIVKQFTDRRIRYWYQAHSGLPASARNAGIRLSQGEYIAFLDGDDLWYPQKLEKVVAVFRSEPDVGVVCHDNYIREGEELVGTLRCGPLEPDVFKCLLFKGNSIATSGTTVRREILEKMGGFNERRDFWCVEDYDLWMRIARETKVEFYFLPEVLGEYRVHESNSSNDPGRFYRNLRSVLIEHFRHVSAPSWSEWLLHRRNLAAIHYACGGSFRRRGELLPACREYIRAVALDPLYVRKFVRAVPKVFRRARGWGVVP